jgi:uncharacterized protein (DUF1800 family)
LASPLLQDERDIRRLLAQATFGATPALVARVKAIGPQAWVDEQLRMPLAHTHLATAEAAARALGHSSPSQYELVHSWWTHALTDPAQLRQRVAFALSEIFVVSTKGGGLGENGRMGASYLDMLTDKSAGNYRELLEAVALHPAMGNYLSHIRNRKEDPATGRTPDENFAREIMQLFSIGLYELNDDGTLKLREGKPIETFGPEDVKGLAKVFTGWASARPPGSDAPWWACYWLGPLCKDPAQDILPMEGYPQEHSRSEKRFLGVKVDYQLNPDPQESLQIALDRLASHPNTAPFISRQLILRLVTSNPSPAYVKRVVGVFRASNGQFNQVIKAILLDPEARNPAAQGVDMSTYGLLREPVLRLSQMLRALPHTSKQYALGGPIPFYETANSDDAGLGLGQTPMGSPSVFNFFRPGYRPPQSTLAARQLVAPELQLVNENAVIGYARFMAALIRRGWGGHMRDGWGDIRMNLDPISALDQGSPQEGAKALVDDLCHRLLVAPMPEPTYSELVKAVAEMPRDYPDARRHRAAAAMLLVLVSPSYLIQQ